MLDDRRLLGWMGEASIGRPMLLQPRLVNDPSLRAVSNGALATVRVLTCLNERDAPEVMGAVLRMAMGANRTVDNLHAGGIASAVDLASGRLGPATNLGMNASLGWLSAHPQSGAPIEAQTLPRWREVLALARRAHMAFADHALVGWDIAVTAKGPVLVEGNSGPDLDIMQRVSREPLGAGRLGELICLHLDRCAHGAGDAARWSGRQAA